MILNQMDEINSFNAVRDFLQNKDLYKGGFLSVQIMIESEAGRHFMNDNLEITFYEREAVYTFYSNCFYQYTKKDKLKSSESLFQWDDNKKELHTFYEKNKIVIKRN